MARATEPNIIQAAMIYLGERYDQGSHIYTSMAFRLPEIRDRLLYDMRWNFATGITELAEAPLPAAAVDSGQADGSRTYTKAFTIPSSVIRVLGLNADNQEGHGARGIDTLADFVIAGDLLMADRSSEGAGSSEKLAVWVIRQITAPADWDPVFAELLTVDLALAIGFLATTNPAALQYLVALREDLYRSALTVNAQENAPNVLAARSGYIEPRYQAAAQEPTRNVLTR